LHLKEGPAQLQGWKKMVQTLKNPDHQITIGIVGKYVDLKESYKSLNEAIVHGGIANHTKVNILYIDSETLTDRNAAMALADVHGVLVPGGFGERGADGKLSAIRYARENKIPFFGICFGMQLAAIEFARNVCGIKDATSREFDAEKSSKNFVIDFMEEQKQVRQKGGTMRLGAYPCTLTKGSRARRIYDAQVIHERHRHRYEFNNRYCSLFEKRGMNLSGICEDRDLVEIIEITEHPWFVGVQFHPEFKSRPLAPHPLFTSFVAGALDHKNQRIKIRSGVQRKMRAVKSSREAIS
jgi:CTP synthase